MSAFDWPLTALSVLSVFTWALFAGVTWRLMVAYVEWEEPIFGVFVAFVIWPLVLALILGWRIAKRWSS